MCQLGVLLVNGQGSSKNVKEGVQYLKKSIDKGDSSGMLCYATMLFRGENIPKNPQEATQLIKIDKGNSNAMYKYGNVLHHGYGIPVNKEEAVQLQNGN